MVGIVFCVGMMIVPSIVLTIATKNSKSTDSTIFVGTAK